MKATAMQDTQFEHELEVFRTEAESGIQFFYAYLAVHAVAEHHQSVYQLLNKAPLFWNTSLGALQTAAFIALGRVFDQNSTHNLDRLLRAAQSNLQLFSKAALGRRKQGANVEPPEWLEDYLSDVYEPTPQDFRRLRSYVRKWRKIYESNYRDLRHKLFAHKEVADRADIDALFAKTNINELQRMFTFLSSLHGALWQLFFNGRKPVLRPQRYSVKRMRDLPSPANRGKALQERILHEAEQFLTTLAGPIQQRDTGNSR
jgi:hypothetical protein